MGSSEPGDTRPCTNAQLTVRLAKAEDALRVLLSSTLKLASTSALKMKAAAREMMPELGRVASALGVVEAPSTAKTDEGEPDPDNEEGWFD